MKKMRIPSLILAVLMIVTMVPMGALLTSADGEEVTAASWYEAETGDETPNLLEIDNEAELLAFAEKMLETNYEGKTIQLTANITMNRGFNAKAETVTAPAVVWPISNQAFAGTFDGNGKYISGIYQDGGAIKGVGILGSADLTARVQNLAIKNSYTISSAGTEIHHGGLFGNVKATATDVTIDSVYADIVVVNTLFANGGVGGIIGSVTGKATITNSMFLGDVIADARGTAGIVGEVRGSAEGDATKATCIVSDCLFSGTVTNASTGQVGAAGLVGYYNFKTDVMNVSKSISVGRVDTAAATTQAGIAIGFSHSPDNWQAVIDTATVLYLVNSNNITNGVGTFGGKAGIYSATQVTESELTGANAGTKLTGLGMTGWTCMTGSCPFPTSLYSFVTDESNDSQSAIPTPDTNWYGNQIGDATPDLLEIYNADDLLAFADAIMDGTTFEGKTITLVDSITMNADFDAFAQAVTAPTTVWPINNEAFFAGTFDGAGNTISGIYQVGHDRMGAKSLGIFGSVPTGKTATVENVILLNTYTKHTHDDAADSGFAHGAIFGKVSASDAAAVIENVSVTAKVVNTAAGDGVLGTAGFVGGNKGDVTINKSVFSGEISAAQSGVGAFVGVVRSDNGADTKTLITDSYTDAKVSGASYVGGLIGYLHGTTEVVEIKKTIVNSTVTATAKGGAVMGGTAAASMDVKLEGVYFINDNASVAIGAQGGMAIEAAETPIGKSIAELSGVYGMKVLQDAGMTEWVATGSLPMIKAIYDNSHMGITGESVTVTNKLHYNIYMKLNVSEATVKFILNEKENSAVSVKGVPQSNGVMKFTLDLSFSQMVDTIDVDYNEGEYTHSTTVKAYLEKLMVLDPAVASDMLRLGAAAQTKDNYKTNALATANVTLAQGAGDTTAALTAATTLAGDTTEGYSWGTPVVKTDGQMAVLLKMTAFTTEGRMKIIVTVNGRETELYYSELHIVPTESRTYTMAFCDIGIDEMDSAITVKLIINDKQVGQTLTTSVNACVKASVTDANASANDVAYVKALHAVSVSIAAYNAN